MVRLVRLHHVHHVVGDAPPLLRARLARPHVHPPIHLTGIHADDLDGQGARELERDRRLADPGGSHDREERRRPGYQSRRSSRRMSRRGIRETTGRPCGQ